MTNPSDIGHGFLANLRGVPEIVAQMGGDESRINFYEDQFPGTVSRRFAITQMQPPSMLLTFEGAGPGVFGNMEVWKHRFALVMRPLTAATDLWYWVINGVSAGQPLRMLYLAPHPNCYRMDVPNMQRNSLFIGETDIDYYEAQIVFTEMGDSL